MTCYWRHFYNNLKHNSFLYTSFLFVIAHIFYVHNITSNNINLSKTLLRKIFATQDSVHMLKSKQPSLEETLSRLLIF